MINAIIHSLVLVFSLCTATSLLIHDTNADKALIKAVTTHNYGAPGPGADPHTHVHRASGNSADRDVRNSHPRTAPRAALDRRYMHVKITRGHHPFEDYLLPVS